MGAISTPLRVLIAGAFLLIAACSSGEDVATAEREVEKFHRAFDAGEFGEIYDKASDDFLKGSKEELVAFMETLRRKLGKIVQTKRANFSVHYGGGSARVTLIYETTFSEGKGAEKFNYLVSGKKALLVGYRIDSKDLLN